MKTQILLVTLSLLFLSIDEISVNAAARPKPVAGNWSKWSAWGACSVTCGNGVQSRSHACNSPAPKNGGAACKGAPTTTQPCRKPACKPINGGWSAWSAWGTCSATCGNGTQSSTRQCNNPPAQYGGANCKDLNTTTRGCNITPCPINGGWSAWSAWGTCSATCGNGTQYSTRQCNNPPAQYGGANCKDLNTTTRGCNITPCPNPCASRPCTNPNGLTGTCTSTSTSSSYQCVCDGGYTGVNCQTPPVGKKQKGLTFGVAKHVNDVYEVQCNAASVACEPFNGDTNCATALPILCISKKNTQPSPTGSWAGTGTGYGNTGWTGGNIALTTNVIGSDMTSRSVANSICSTQLGNGWAMAEWHDKGDGGFLAYGNVSASTRFWASIDSTNGNCWN